MANRWNFPDLGFGIGLRTVHYGTILANNPPVDWFEVLSENYMDTEGRPLYVLDQVAERYPVVLHGVSMSVGSTDPLNVDFLTKLKALAERTRAIWVSDHLCWTGVSGLNVHDLLPMPYTDESLRYTISRVKTISEFLERPLILENPSTYLEFGTSTWIRASKSFTPRRSKLGSIAGCPSWSRSELMAPKLSLEKTQFWMQEVIMHPGTNEEAIASPKAQAIVSERRFPRVVLPSKTLNSYLRIGIYRDMYLARLREALASDYPTLVHYLGDDAFTRLVSGYVQAYPSRSYTLNRLGDHLPEYIRSASGLARREFLYDLALLELAMSQVFDAEESAVLTPEAITAVPPDAWETVRLKPIRAFRLLSFRYPVNACVQSVKEGAALPKTRRKSNWVVVFRRNYSLWRLDLTRQAHDLLQSLVSGKPLGGALSTSLARNRRSVSEVQLFSWFREWVADGLFHAIESTT